MARDSWLLTKFARMVETVQREQERQWNTLISAFPEYFIALIENATDIDLGLIDTFHICAKLLDCCETVERDALGKNSVAIEQSVPTTAANDAHALDEFMSGILEDAPNRGYVYIAWSARPETYWYVGQATREDRLMRHRRHGNLVLALRDASRFTVVFPSVEARIRDLESAILRILRDVDMPPCHNGDHLPAAPQGERQARLARMGKTLARLAKRIG